MSHLHLYVQLMGWVDFTPTFVVVHSITNKGKKKGKTRWGLGVPRCHNYICIVQFKNVGGALGWSARDVACTFVLYNLRVGPGRILNSFEILWLSSLPARVKKIRSKMKALESNNITHLFTGTLGSLKCLAQGHYTATVGFECWTSHSGVRRSTTRPPRSLYYEVLIILNMC